jgi:hypothetical protein
MRPESWGERVHAPYGHCGQASEPRVVVQGPRVNARSQVRGQEPRTRRRPQVPTLLRPGTSHSPPTPLQPTPRVLPVTDAPVLPPRSCLLLLILRAPVPGCAGGSRHRCRAQRSNKQVLSSLSPPPPPLPPCSRLGILGYLYLGLSWVYRGSIFVGGVCSPQLSLQILPALSLCLVA